MTSNAVDAGNQRVFRAFGIPGGTALSIEGWREGVDTHADVGWYRCELRACDVLPL